MRLKEGFGLSTLRIRCTLEGYFAGLLTMADNLTMPLMGLSLAEPQGCLP